MNFAKIYDGKYEEKEFECFEYKDDSLETILDLKEKENISKSEKNKKI